MITNPKIERKRTDIARTEVRLAEVKARLREQKQELVKLENDEIVAMFRSELLTEDGFAALMRARREAQIDDDDDLPDERAPSNTPFTQNENSNTAQKRKEEATDALIEN